MPTTFNFSQLTSIDEDWESGTDGHVGSKQPNKNKINAEHLCIEELNLESL
ncbi:TPA: hypothetical protein NQN67_002115 [Legionella pneumophila]|nr:hypothetical protein [Legionella pneumophila]